MPVEIGKKEILRRCVSRFGRISVWGACPLGEGITWLLWSAHFQVSDVRGDEHSIDSVEGAHGRIKMWAKRTKEGVAGKACTERKRGQTKISSTTTNQSHRELTHQRSDTAQANRSGHPLTQRDMHGYREVFTSTHLHTWSHDSGDDDFGDKAETKKATNTAGWGTDKTHAPK